MAISAEQLADLILATRDKQDNQLSNLVHSLQKYKVLNHLLGGDESRVKAYTGGKYVTFNARINTPGNAKHTGLFNQDSIAITDTMITGSVPWRHTEGGYAFDVGEDAINEGAEAIVDLVKSRRDEMWDDMAKLLESTVASKPATSADNVTPYGLGMYIVKNASEGWNGGNPSGFTSGTAGIDADTYDGWNNYTGTYSAVTKADFIAKVKRAIRKCNFVPPVRSQIPEYNNNWGWSLYTCNDVYESCLQLLETSNDKITDLAGYNECIISGIPLEWWPQLDSDSDDPVYGVNWNHMEFAVLGDKDAKSGKRVATFKESAPRKSPLMHNVVEVFADLRWQLVCRNRREQFVLYAA